MREPVAAAAKRGGLKPGPARGLSAGQGGRSIASSSRHRRAGICARRPSRMAPRTARDNPSGPECEAPSARGTARVKGGGAPPAAAGRGSQDEPRPRRAAPGRGRAVVAPTRSRGAVCRRWAHACTGGTRNRSRNGAATKRGIRLPPPVRRYSSGTERGTRRGRLEKRPPGEPR